MAALLKREGLVTRATLDKFVGEGNASASRRREGAVKEGSGFLSSKRVLGRAIAARAIKASAIEAWAIKAGVIEVDSGSYCQGGCGFTKQIKRRINLASGPFLFMAVVAGRAVAGRSGLDSLHAQQAHCNMRSSCAEACGTDGRCLG